MILSKPIALEGTAILAAEAEAALRAGGADAADLRAARTLLDEPGVSVLPESRILCRGTLPHALHDVTEGGLATALRELAEASGVGLRIQRDAIPILPACSQLCSILGLDPLGLIGSGSLLAAVAPEDAEEACTALRSAGLSGACIGAVTDGSALELVEADGRQSSLPVFDRDEIARYFEERAE